MVIHLDAKVSHDMQYKCSDGEPLHLVNASPQLHASAVLCMMHHPVIRPICWFICILKQAAVGLGGF